MGGWFDRAMAGVEILFRLAAPVAALVALLGGGRSVEATTGDPTWLAASRGGGLVAVPGGLAPFAGRATVLASS